MRSTLAPANPLAANSALAAAKIRVARVSDGKDMGVEIPIRNLKRTAAILGRSRWMPDSKAIAEKLHGLKLTAKEHPGVLMDVSWDDTGEMSRESFVVKVENGKQVVQAVLPPN